METTIGSVSNAVSSHQYDASLRCWSDELDLRRQHQINFYKLHLRDLVHRFAELIIDDLDNISENAILEILAALNDELLNGRDNDHNLLTRFYLITVISHVCIDLMLKQSS